MSVTLSTLFLDDPEPVFAWPDQHGGSHVVRKQAKQMASGWFVKVAFDNTDLSAKFGSRWGDAVLTLDNQRKWLEQRRLSASRSTTSPVESGDLIGRTRPLQRG